MEVREKPMMESGNRDADRLFADRAGAAHAVQIPPRPPRYMAEWQQALCAVTESEEQF
jgi:hypothetical protein